MNADQMFQAWKTGRPVADQRQRCDRGHIMCDSCTACPCSPRSGAWGTGRATKGKDGRTMCSDCRHDFNEMGEV